FPWDMAPVYMIRDLDSIYGTVVTRRLRAMGIRDKPIAPASPWQNGFAERLIGSIRRECLDHIIVLGEVHLRRILKSYARYYNETRTHLALDKDAPLSRTGQGAFFAARSSADCTTNMFGFDFRQAQEMMPSFAPSNATRSQPMRSIKRVDLTGASSDRQSPRRYGWSRHTFA